MEFVLIKQLNYHVIVFVTLQTIAPVL